MHKIRPARAVALSIPLALALSGTLVAGAGAATSLAPDSPNVTRLLERPAGATTADSATPITGLTSGASAVFDNGAGVVTTLTMQTDGTLVLTKTGETEPVWSIVTGAPDSFLTVGDDGNFGIWDGGDDKQAWHANTSNGDDPGTVELREGALVVVHAGEVTATNPAGEFFPGYPKTDGGDPGGEFTELSDLAAGEQASYTNADDEVTTLTMGADGTLVLAKDGTTIKEWETGAPGTGLYVGDDGNVTLWDTAADTWAWQTGTPNEDDPGSVELRDGALVVEQDGDLVFSNGDGLYNEDEGYPKSDGGDPGPGDATEVTSLAAGESIELPEGGRLSMQGDGNLVVYDADGKATFNTRTFVPGSRLAVQSDGNVVVYGPDGRWLWQSATAGNSDAEVVLEDGDLIVRNDDTVLFDSATNTGTRNTTLVTALRSNSSASSANGRYLLAMQADGNAVLYDTGANHKVLWNSGTFGNQDARLVAQGDGNVVVYSTANKALWNSGTQGNPGATLALQNDGNLVLYSSANRALWWTMR